MASGAFRTARMLDQWVTEREADATSLTDLATIHGTDSTRISPAIAGQIIRLQMHSLLARGFYDGVWMVGGTGHVMGAVGNKALTPAEDSAAALAMATGRMQVSRPQRHDSTYTVGVAKPIMTTASGVTRAEGAVVLRAQLDRVLPSGTSTRLPANMSIVVIVPTGATKLGLSICRRPLARMCTFTG
jgi:hypothetical protein